MTRQSRFIIYGLVAVGAYLLYKQMQPKLSGLRETDYLDHGLGAMFSKINTASDPIMQMKNAPVYTGIRRQVGRAAT